MRRVAFVATAASVAALAGAAPAVAAGPPQPPSRDTVTGSFSIGPGTGTSEFVVDASSSPAGEAPSGEIQMRSAFFSADLAVTCLRVRGNRAVVGGRFGNVNVILILEDGLAGAPDQGGLEIEENLFGPSCADVNIDVTGLLAFRVGSVTIVDAPVRPTSKEDCRDDGWRQLGFTNRGACQRLVPHPPGAPVASG
jgi:hypothetical protein